MVQCLEADAVTVDQAEIQGVEGWHGGHDDVVVVRVTEEDEGLVLVALPPLQLGACRDVKGTQLCQYTF